MVAITFLFYLVFLCIAGNEGRSAIPRQQLVNNLLRGYDKRYQSDNTSVTFNPGLTRVISLDETEESVKLELRQSFSWIDNRLVWNPDMAEKFQIEARYIWSAFENTHLQIGTEEFASDAKSEWYITVSFNGSVNELAHVIVEVPCEKEATQCRHDVVTYQCSLVYQLKSDDRVFFDSENMPQVDIQRIKTPSNQEILETYTEITDNSNTRFKMVFDISRKT
ncbi:acetylcholine receptor subunit beta-like [Ptychodera flava]|uniref:acetylcholine receptor subunit beta-like n=1 Tax=Ptychodera flava TaxID=63121 RepID=UPI00396A4184